MLNPKIKMSYSIDDIKKTIEKIESERAADKLFLYEQQEGFLEKQLTVVETKKGYLEFIAGLSIGISTGVASILINYIVIVRLLHIEF